MDNQTVRNRVNRLINHQGNFLPSARYEEEYIIEAKQFIQEIKNTPYERLFQPFETAIKDKLIFKSKTILKEIELSL